MEVGKFLLLAVGRGVRFMHSSSEVTKTKELTTEIDYGCAFDEKGLCVQERGHAERNRHADSMCCCRSCHLDLGYLRVLPRSERELRQLARRFNEKTGFWREGKGCGLPRNQRSATCLTHYCYEVAKVTDGDKLLLRLVRQHEEMEQAGLCPGR